MGTMCQDVVMYSTDRGTAAREGGSMFSTEFDQDATRAAILYAASSVAAPGLHKICKLFYFADRLHLERYGSLMFGDEYGAWKYGPVPLGAYQLMKDAQRHPEAACTFGFTVQHQEVSGWTAPVVIPHEAPDLDELAASVLECLDFAVQHYGEGTFSELTAVSHDAAWNAAGPDGEMTPELIASTLPNAAAVLEHLRNPYPDA